MKNYSEILSSCPLFCNIDKKDIEPMLLCLDAKIKSFDKNETVFAEGDDLKNIGIVLSGAVQIEQTDYFGNRSIVANVGQSELFGESFACADVKKIPVNVIAKEKSEILLADSKKILFSCTNGCDFHRQMIFNLMKIVATKNLVFHQKIQITSKRTTREKLMSYLMIQAKKNNSDSFYIPFDRQELADYIEVDRSGLSAEISKLRKEGIIECRKNHFQIYENDIYKNI